MALTVRTQFGDLNFDTALPALMEVIQNAHNMKASVTEMCYNISSTDRSVEQSTGVSGFGRFAETAEGEEHASDLVYQRYDKTYTPQKYTLGFSMTKELIDDDKFGVVSKFATALGRSAHDTKEFHGAELFNDAFDGNTFTGGDGQPLCDTAHPLVAGTEQNELTTAADLSVTSLQQAINDLQDTTDDRGLQLEVMAEKLLIPNELQWVANELLNSVQLPGTANNNTNSVKNLTSLQPVVWTYLTDPDAWFLLGSKEDHDLQWINRYNFTVEDYDKPSNQSKVVYGYMKYARGFNGWRGVFGSPGA